MMSQYSDAQAVQMSRAEEGSLLEPDEFTAEEQEPVRGDAATSQPVLRPVRLVQIGATETDSDDYMHTSYELRAESGEVLGAFTTRIDGRS